MTLPLLALLSALTWYPADTWVDRVDPLADPFARKGGTLRFNGGQPPKSLNAYVDNNTYTAMTFDLMYENLLGIDSDTLEFVPALARRWAVSSDGETFVFELDERARWSDGQPVTAADVKWTFDTVLAPESDTGAWKVMLGAFESPEVLGERTIRFHKKSGSTRDWRDLRNCAMFWILPRHAFAGRNFNAVDFQEIPVSGAYRVARVVEQVETEFVRRPNWWRANFPSCQNICNFDRILLRYFADNENAFEALKARTIDVYPVYTARLMAQETHGEKFEKRWILQRRVKNHHPIGFQGFAMNQRRKPFDDLRVRQAMSLLIDRETMNRTMMFNEYFLLNSYYADLYDLQHPCTNRLFGYDVAEAKRLLREAGYEKGFTFTFLSRSSMEEKFLSLFNHALAQCGVTMRIVRKDFAGWMRDMDAFNFDMTWAAWGAALFKSPETMWLSSEADRQGSNNITGFKSARVDRLIAVEKGFAHVPERLAAYREIDAEIAAACPYALLWQTDTVRLLYWNKFSMPRGVLSRYADESAVLSYWWYDEDKARELKEAMATGDFLPKVPIHVTTDEVQHD